MISPRISDHRSLLIILLQRYILSSTPPHATCNTIVAATLSTSPFVIIIRVISVIEGVWQWYFSRYTVLIHVTQVFVLKTD